jgi:hypothetical protein
LIILFAFVGARVDAEQPAAPAQVLYDLLVSGSFDESELPPGFTRPRVTPTAPEDLDDGAIGGVDVAVAVPDFANVAIASHQIAYRVYATPTDAEQAVQLARTRTKLLGGQDAELSGFDYPAVLLQTFGSARGGAAAGSICLVQVGEIVVAGISVLEQRAQSQADINASDLAQAGVAHLDRLIFDAAAAATPRAAR